MGNCGPGLAVRGTPTFEDLDILKIEITAGAELDVDTGSQQNQEHQDV